MSFGRLGPVKRYSAGDRVHVVLERIDAVERRLQFGIYVDLETLNNALRKPAKQKSSAKKAEKKSAKSKQSPPARFAAVAKSGKPKKSRDKNKGKRRK
jgi:ribonuclease R